MYEISLLNTCTEEFYMKKDVIICVYMLISMLCLSTYSAELLALVSHLFPYRPALCSEAVPQVDSVDGRARLLVQRGLLANPVEDLPAQGPVVI